MDTDNDLTNPHPAHDMDDEEMDAPDASLGGYLDVHNRPPAFEGTDGRPYTVSIEVEKAADSRTPFTPFVGYLVFPRWADTGLGIVGHVETPVLWKGTTEAEVTELAGALELAEVKALLDEAIDRQGEAD